MKFTYVGDGNQSPAEIHFMGREKFKLNVAKEVTDEELIAKLKGNPCFVEGEVEQDDNQVGYRAMLAVLKEASVKPETRSKEHVKYAYESIAA